MVCHGGCHKIALGTPRHLRFRFDDWCTQLLAYLAESLLEGMAHDSLGQAQLKQGPKWLASLTTEVTGMLEKADQEVEDDGFMRESSFLLVSPSSGRQPTCVCVGQ